MQDISINTFQGSMNMDVNPTFVKDGDYVHARNVRIGYSENGGVGCVENMRGTLEVNNPNLTDKTRWKVVGAAVYEADRKIYQFRKDTKGTEDYIEEYNYSTSTFTVIVKGNLSLPKKITSAFYFNGMLIWNDKKKGIKQIDVALAKSGYKYDRDNTDMLIKIAPDNVIQTTKVESSPLVIGSLLVSQYQFVYRYIFVRNQMSSWSSPSDACVVSTATLERIDLAVNSSHIQLCDLYVGFIDFVEIGFREDTTQPYRTIGRTKFPSVRSASFVVPFKNDALFPVTSSDQTSNPYSDVPLKSGDIAVVSNRLLSGGNTYGYANVQVSALLFNITTTALVDKNKYMLTGGIYSIGVQLYDEFRRRSFVYPLGSFRQDWRNGTFAPKTVELALYAKLPGWVHSWQLVATNCQNIGDYIQVHIDYVSSSGTEIRFKNTFISPTPVSNSWGYTLGDKVSFLTKNAAGDSYSGSNVEIDLEYDTLNAQYVAKGNFSGFGAGALAMIYAPIKSATTSFYYEISDVYMPTEVNGVKYFGSDYNSTSKYVKLNWGDTIWDATQSAQLRNIDQAKYDTWFRNNGKPNAVSENIQKEVYFGNEIAFSEPLIQNTGVNGFNSFLFESKQTYGIEFGDITRLTLATDFKINGSVLLVTTKTNNYSVYIGKVQFQATDGNATLGVSTQLLGSANLLSGGYGSINPETVHAFGTTVRGWDALKGVFWRYSQDGLTPISMEYGANKYARNLKVEESEDDYQHALSCYDPFYDEWVLHTKNTDKTEAIAFNESKNGFSVFYDMEIDWMSTIANTYVSWLNGVMYIHNKGSEYNKIHGETVKSNLTCVCKANETTFDTINAISLHLYAQDNWSVNAQGIKRTIGTTQNTSMSESFGVLNEDYYEYPIATDAESNPMKSRYFLVEAELSNVPYYSALYAIQLRFAVSPQSPTKA